MTRSAAAALVALLLGSACVPDPGPAARSEEAYLHVLAAEDARPPAGPELDLLVEALGSRRDLLRRTAVRALGRLERPELADRIAPLLLDPDAGVRAEAAHALAQSVHGTGGSPVLDALLSRAGREKDPAARGALAASLGALELDRPDRRRVATALIALSHGASDNDDAPTETLVGVALGFESLMREDDAGGLGRAAAARLEELLTYRAGDPSPDAGHVRALALSTLSRARRMSLSLVELGLGDIDPEVRRQAVRTLDAVVPSRRDELLHLALADTSLQVSLEALRYVAEGERTPVACAELLAAAQTEMEVPVRVSALDALARPCPSLAPQRTLLTRVADGLEADPTSVWQPPTHALQSLAHIDHDRAVALLPRFAGHESPFVRAHAAQVAGALRDDGTLRALAEDPSANVRTAALGALFDLEGHAVDPLLLGALSGDDPQLLFTVTGLLEGSPLGGQAAPALLDAFDRLSAQRRETLRDPRHALLERVAELGSPTLAGRLRPYLTDYDPVIAADVATLIASWTDEDTHPDPRPLPRAPLPTADELAALASTTVALHMRDGGSIVVRPLPDVAPTNAARFVRLARAGYYDGLTFHRWAPDFVIQGGSPGANEYSGDTLYSRDEIGRQPHWRGAVGVSTRGRDTGDGQIFIDLVDNPRLNGEYTVLGRVVEGMRVADRVLEGAVIEHAEVRVGR